MYLDFSIARDINFYFTKNEIKLIYKDHLTGVHMFSFIYKPSLNVDYLFCGMMRRVVY